MAKMTYHVRKRIGKEVHSFSIEGKNLHEVVMEAKKLSFDDIHQCGLCGSDELELSAHDTEDKGFEYTYVRCKKCRATLNFGQQTKNKEIYYLRMVDITSGPHQGRKAYDWKPFVPEQK